MCFTNLHKLLSSSAIAISISGNNPISNTVCLRLNSNLPLHSHYLVSPHRSTPTLTLSHSTCHSARRRRRPMHGYYPDPAANLLNPLAFPPPSLPVPSAPPTVAGLKWDDSSRRGPTVSTLGASYEAWFHRVPHYRSRDALGTADRQKCGRGGRTCGPRSSKHCGPAHDYRRFVHLVLYARSFWISYIATFPLANPYLYSPSGGQNKRPNGSSHPCQK